MADQLSLPGDVIGAPYAAMVRNGEIRRIEMCLEWSKDMTENTSSGWRFIGDDATFRLDAPHRTSYLYFPLVNEAGMMSVVTPTLHGDTKTGQNTFLTAPVSVEDLHNTRSARNFWVYCRGSGAVVGHGQLGAAGRQDFARRSPRRRSRWRPDCSGTR